MGKPVVESGDVIAVGDNGSLPVSSVPIGTVLGNAPLLQQPHYFQRVLARACENAVGGGELGFDGRFFPSRETQSIYITNSRYTEQM
jgi:hypothetical protein